MQQEFAIDNPSNGQADAQSEPAQPAITSLDSLSEFEFQGEKMTPDRLQEVMQGFKTLSERQKQSQSEDRYWANLDIDLESVLADPNLAQRFKSIYPEKFHKIVDRLLAGQSPQQAQSPQSQLPKEYLAKLSKVDHLEQTLQQMAIESANAKLDAILPKLYEKYPLANEDQVLAKAESMLSQGMKMTDAVWERIAKESHEGQRKKSDSYYKSQLQTQIDKGQAGRDAGPGGSAPGKAPQKLRTFDDAREAMIAELKSRGMS